MAQLNGSSSTKSDISPAKHTDSAHMPDLSPGAESMKRLRANFGAMGSKKGVAMMAGVAVVAIGAYWFYKRSKNGSFKSDSSKFSSSGSSKSPFVGSTAGKRSSGLNQSAAV